MKTTPSVNLPHSRADKLSSYIANTSNNYNVTYDLTQRKFIDYVFDQSQKEPPVFQQSTFFKDCLKLGLCTPRPKVYKNFFIDKEQ